MKKIIITLIISLEILILAGIANASKIWFVTQGTWGNYQQNIGHLFSWDPATNVITDRGVLNRGAWGDIAMSPSGNLYGISWKNGVYGGGTYLFKITPGSAYSPAAYTLLASTNIGLNALGWADGGLWAAASNGNSLYRWIKCKGIWQFSTIDGPFDSSGDIELSPDGTLYAFGGTTTSSTLYSINKTTGIPNKIGVLDHRFYGLGFDGYTMYGFDNDQGGFGLGSDIYKIDPATLTSTKVCDLNMNVWGATYSPNPTSTTTTTPDPGTIWLLGSGLVSLTSLGSKKKEERKK